MSCTCLHPSKVVDCPAIFVHSPTQTEVIVAQVYMQGMLVYFLYLFIKQIIEELKLKPKTDQYLLLMTL